MEEKQLSSLVLSLGSNLNDRKDVILKSLKYIENEIGSIEKSSSFYSSESWGFEGNDFLNVSVLIKTSLDVFECLQKCLSIESNLGRTRIENADSYQNRVIDIDIIFFNSDIVNLKKLKIPHPRFMERNFVLLPTAEIIPNFIPPNSSLNVSELRESCADLSRCEKVKV